MILPGDVVHVCWYGIKAFRVCICVCARSYVLWEESEESDAGKCTIVVVPGVHVKYKK